MIIHKYIVLCNINTIYYTLYLIVNKFIYIYIYISIYIYINIIFFFKLINH